MIARPVPQLLLLAGAMVIAGYVRTALSPLQDTMRIALSLSDSQMALLQGPAIGIPVAIAAIPLGLLIDRSVRVRILWVLAALSMLASFATASVTDFALLLLVRGVAGVAALAIVPVVFSLIADHFPAAMRGRATMVVFIGQVAGNSAAFALGGVLLANASGADGWRWAMFWLTAAIVPIALSLLALREPERTEMASPNPSLRQIWEVLDRQRSMVAALALGIVMVEMALGATLIWSAPMLSRRFALAADQVGMIMAAGMMISGVLGPIVGGVLADFCQRRGGPAMTMRVLAVMAVLGVPLGCYVAMSGALGASILLTAAMTLIIAVATMGMALITVVVPNELRGLCMSMLTAVILLFALAVAPVVVSELSEFLGGLAAIGTSLSVVCMSALLLSAVAFVMAGRANERSR